MAKLHFTLLLQPGFSLLSVGGFLDKLRFSSDEEDYSRQIHCSWRLTSLHGEPVHSSSGVCLQPECALDTLTFSARDENHLVIFGSNAPQRVMEEASSYIPLLKKLSRQKVRLSSVDNAAFLLAAAGLAGKKALVHWRHAEEFRALFPTIGLVADRTVYQEKNIVYCPGGSTAIEMAAYLLEQSLGRQKAVKGLSDMLVGRFPPPQEIFWTRAELDACSADVVRTLVFMRQHIAGKLSADDIAAQTGLSRRQLDRNFLRQTGMTVHQSFADMKLAFAKWLLLRTTRSLSHIAEDVGFNDTSYFCRLFRQQTGSSPSRWRQTHRLS